MDMDRNRKDIGYAPNNKQTSKSSRTESVLIFLSLILFVVTMPLSIFFCLHVLAEYKRAVVFRLGRLRPGSARGPGLVFAYPCVDQLIKVDLRTTSYDVPAQEILTKDHVTISLDAVVYYRIFDPLKSVTQVRNVHFATKMLAQTTLRNVAGQKHVIELMSEKDSVSMAIAAILKTATVAWGVYVERVEIKDVRLPHLLQRAMAAEAEAIREAKAKVVAAEGELLASKALKDASDVISSNPVALQLRYLQTLTVISSDQNHNIIFPFPVNLIRSLLGGRNNEVTNNNYKKGPLGEPSTSTNQLPADQSEIRKVDVYIEEAFREMDRTDRGGPSGSKDFRNMGDCCKDHKHSDNEPSSSDRKGPGNRRDSSDRQDSGNRRESSDQRYSKDRPDHNEIGSNESNAGSFVTVAGSYQNRDTIVKVIDSALQNLDEENKKMNVRNK